MFACGEPWLLCHGHLQCGWRSHFPWLPTDSIADTGDTGAHTNSQLVSHTCNLPSNSITHIYLLPLRNAHQPFTRYHTGAIAHSDAAAIEVSHTQPLDLPDQQAFACAHAEPDIKAVTVADRLCVNHALPDTLLSANAQPQCSLPNRRHYAHPNNHTHTNAHCPSNLRADIRSDADTHTPSIDRAYCGSDTCTIYCPNCTAHTGAYQNANLDPKCSSHSFAHISWWANGNPNVHTIVLPLGSCHSNSDRISHIRSECYHHIGSHSCSHRCAHIHPHKHPDSDPNRDPDIRSNSCADVPGHRQSYSCTNLFPNPGAEQFPQYSYADNNPVTDTDTDPVSDTSSVIHSYATANSGSVILPHGATHSLSNSETHHSADLYTYYDPDIFSNKLCPHSNSNVRHAKAMRP